MTDVKTYLKSSGLASRLLVVTMALPEDLVQFFRPRSWGEQEWTCLSCKLTNNTFDNARYKLCI